ncbi:hypothetical protein HMPREF9069_01512 [Atopobium sp. oral taxon 810 str. F0209]|nr:hypothetical protein HMPREF9069_01512 [Atopobium sp. oral taxon 810 str. F0209]
MTEDVLLHTQLHLYGQTHHRVEQQNQPLSQVWDENRILAECAWISLLLWSYEFIATQTENEFIATQIDCEFMVTQAEY